MVKVTFYCLFVCPCFGKKWLFYFFERWQKINVLDRAVALFSACR
jgi:hypothetical protein